MSPTKTTKKKTAGAARSKGSAGLSAEEKAALRETIRERKQLLNREEGEKALLAKIAEMPEHDRSLGKKIHSIVTANAPELAPRTWYGMPAYADKDGKIVCFFQAADKFKARYASFGFDQAAKLDDGHMWATSFALKEMTPAEEAKLAALVRKAVS